MKPPFNRKHAIAAIAAVFIAALAATLWFSLRGDGAASMSVPDADLHPAGPFKVAVTIDPTQPKVGKNRITITVRDADNRPVTDAVIQAVAEMPAMGSMPAMRAPADLKQDDPGVYRGQFELSMEGAWPLALAITSPTKGNANLSFDLTTSRVGLRLTQATPSALAQASAPPTTGVGLVSVTKQEVQSGTVLIDARRRQLIGVTTGPVERRRLAQTIRAAGRITYDETRLADVTLKFDAWIGELYADSVGAPVKRGAALFTVYSPALLSAQQEYLETWRRRRDGDSLLAAARQRLRLWDLRADQIQALENRGVVQEHLPILSPVTGTVIEKHIVEGSAVKAGQRLLRIADLSKVWVEGEVYEYELPNVKTGMAAEVVLPELPGRGFPAKLIYVDPYVDPKTRTARVRVALPNPDGVLRPDMYAHVHLDVDQGERLVVPEGAVLYAGHSRVVFVDLGEGRLQPRKIKTGARNGEWIEVLEGLQAGETVVTSGNFLIAAESKLKAGIDQW